MGELKLCEECTREKNIFNKQVFCIRLGKEIDRNTCRDMKKERRRFGQAFREKRLLEGEK